MIVLFSHVRTGRWASVMPQKLADTLGLTEHLRSIPIVEPDATHSIGLVVPRREPMTSCDCPGRRGYPVGCHPTRRSSDPAQEGGSIDLFIAPWNSFIVGRRSSAEHPVVKVGEWSAGRSWDGVRGVAALERGRGRGNRPPP